MIQSKKFKREKSILSDRLNTQLILAIFSLVIIFIGDLVISSGFSYWAIYVIPVLIMYNNSSKLLFRLTTFITICMVIGYFFPYFRDIPVFMNIINRGTGIFVVWITSYIITKNSITIKKLQDRTKEAEEWQRTLLAIMEYIPEGIAIADDQCKIRIVSKHGQTLLDNAYTERSILDTLQSGEIINSDFSSSISHIKLPLARAIKEGEIIRELELQHINKQGIKIDLLCNAAPLCDNNGTIFGGIVTFQDITEQKQIESELRIERERLQAIFENVNIGMCVADCNGKILTINRAAIQMYGFNDKSELIDNFSNYEIEFEFQYPDGKPMPFDRWPTTQTINGVFVKNYEVKLIRKKNNFIRNINYTAVPIYSKNGIVANIVYTLVDLTERKSAEETILESEKRFRALVTAGSIAVYRISPDWNNVQIFHDGIFSANVNSSNQTWINEFILPEDRAYVLSAINKAIHSKSIFELEHRVQLDDGTTGWTLSRVIPMLDSTGEIYEWFGTSSNITIRKNLEEQLRKERELLNTIIDTIPIMITLYDPQLKKIHVNKFYERISGWNELDALHNNLIDLAYPDSSYRKMVKEYMESLLPGFKDMIVTAKNGEQIVTSWANIRLPDGRQVGIGIDIRERKRYEEELQRRSVELENVNKELEAFSYSVAHDLRNPLSVIKGYLEIIIEDCFERLDNECRNYVQKINDNTFRMYSIIEDMLALSKISRQEIELVDINLSEMAKKTIDELHKAQPDRAVDVEIKSEMSVQADARLLSVAVGNLLSNAWKYTSKVDHAKIEFGSFSEDGKTIYYVKDNGAGFEMSKAKYLFVPFKRLHSDKEFKGTGVGLAIVERAIKRHGGNIWATSEVGKGATFYFTVN